MDHSLSTFLSGCAPFHDLVFFAKSLDEMDDDDQPNSTFLFIDGEETKRLCKASAAFPAIAMATIKAGGGERTVFALGPNGEFWEFEPANATHADGEIGISDMSWRSLAVVDGELYACGMDRVAAVRTGPQKWRDISAPPAPGGDRIVGFESLDGFTAKDLYAVGWQGEIWHRKGTRWRQVDSPVSINLNAVCCADDGQVYVVGDKGVMLRGRDDTWSEIETGLADNLQDVRDFEGRLYVVTDFAILELVKDKLVPVANFAEGDRPASCLHLLRGEDGLVSLGPKDLFKLHGGNWQRVV